MGDDKLCWIACRLSPTMIGFSKPFYWIIYIYIYIFIYPFSWKSIWCVKSPKRVSFLWTTARGKILTIDNLVKKGLPLVNWCCLDRKSVV